MRLNCGYINEYFTKRFYDDGGYCSMGPETLGETAVIAGSD
jgi:hypothetical protein